MTRHPDWWAALVLLAVALIFLAPVVAQPDGLIYPPRGEFSDLTITHWPNLAFALESLRANGRLPLWRPTIMSGAPLAANPLAGMFYLPHVTFLVLPLAVGLNVLFIAHLWLSGCGAYALLRKWQLERPAALIGALTWMATPKWFAHLGAGHVGLVEALAWMPLAVLAAHRLIASQRARDGVWLGAVLALQFLADPRICFYSVGLAFSYIVIACFAAKTPRRQALMALCVGVLVATVSFAALSALLWLPFAELILQSNRGALTLAEAGEWSLPWRQLVSLVLADWGGSHEWAVYVGILPLLLAVYTAYCVWRRGNTHTQYGIRDTQSIWLVICLVTAALFSLGNNGPLFPILFRLTPGLTLLRVPPRAWFIVAFTVACLCAFGVEAMMREAKKPQGWLTLLSVALAAFALLFGLGGFWILSSSPQATSARAAMLHLALIAPASVIVVLLRAHGRISSKMSAVLAAAVIAATLLPLDMSYYRVISEAQAFSDRADVAAWLVEHAPSEPFRVYSPSYSLPQHVAQRAGLELADGVDPMQIARYARFMEAATGARASGYSVTIPAFPPDSDVRTVWRDARPDARLLGKLNVRYLVADFPIQAEGWVEWAQFGTTRVYENQWAMPRAFVGEGTPARITMLTPDRLVAEVDGPGVLTLSQVSYPGWRAVVDGRAVPIKTAESVLMGVELDAGPHVIEFAFDPWTVKAGVIVSGVGWGSLLAGWLIVRARQAIALRDK